MMGDKYGELIGRLDGLDEFIEDVRKDWNVPALSVCVVKDEGAIYEKGFGLRDPENGLAADKDTVFRLASNTKAFTAASAAILVDEGLLEWDRPIKDYISGFKLYDPYASEHVSMRDLLSHRTGLPAHDWAFRDPGLSAGDIVGRFRYLEPSFELRTKQQYNNWMFMLAGYVIRQVSGKKWDHFVKERILEPLEMNSTNFSQQKLYFSGNYAEHFYEKDGALKKFQMRKETDPDELHPRAPAGAICSSAHDMSKWLILQLNEGRYKDRQIISGQSIREMHAPQMVDNWDSSYKEFGGSSCCLGWFRWSYRGRSIVIHSGAFGSQVIMIPEEKIGIVCLASLATPLQEIIPFHIYDRLFGLDRIPWNERKKEEAAKWKEAEEQQFKNRDSDRKQGTRMSHTVDEYCGIYEHPAYGRICVREEAGGLYIDDVYGRMVLEHYHYETCRAVSDGGERFKITFHTDPKGILSTVSVPFEPAVRDIVFTRKA